jgi:hypothetical protein
MIRNTEFETGLEVLEIGLEVLEKGLEVLGNCTYLELINICKSEAYDLEQLKKSLCVAIKTQNK